MLKIRRRRHPTIDSDRAASQEAKSSRSARTFAAVTSSGLLEAAQRTPSGAVAVRGTATGSRDFPRMLAQLLLLLVSVRAARHVEGQNQAVALSREHLRPLPDQP